MVRSEAGNRTDDRRERIANILRPAGISAKPQDLGRLDRRYEKIVPTVTEAQMAIWKYNVDFDREEYSARTAT